MDRELVLRKHGGNRRPETNLSLSNSAPPYWGGYRSEVENRGRKSTRKVHQTNLKKTFGKGTKKENQRRLASFCFSFLFFLACLFSRLTPVGLEWRSLLCADSGDSCPTPSVPRELAKAAASQLTVSAGLRCCCTPTGLSPALHPASLGRDFVGPPRAS